MQRCLRGFGFALVVVAVVAGWVLYSGRVSVAADEPHAQWLYHLLEWVRERSIAQASRTIEVPKDLDAPRGCWRGEPITMRCVSVVTLRLVSRKATSRWDSIQPLPN